MSLGTIASITGARALGVDDADSVTTTNLCTDTRELGPGDVFVCLQGPHFDGHRFAADALAAGAAGVVTQREVEGVGPQLVVEDTLAALADVARYVRGLGDEHLEAVIAITGSNGKTSTKDLCAAACAARWRTVAPVRSFNNDIGVPRTLFQLDSGVGALVAEVGTNGPGEIARLAALVRPYVGVITNIQPAHLEGLDSLDGITREKGSLLDELTGPSVAVLNRDDSMFDALAERAPGPVVSFGVDSEADVRGVDVDCRPDGTSFLVDGRCPVTLQHLGRHAVSNALAAIAAACAAGVPLEDAAAALADVPPPAGRFVVRRLGALTVVDDCYNANPGSVAAALDVFGGLDVAGRRLAVLGDMLELGDRADELHREVGAHAAAVRLDGLIAVGEYAESIARGFAEGADVHGHEPAPVVVCSARDEVFEHLRGELRRDDAVLVKGSRGMRLEMIVGALGELAEVLP